MAPPTTAADSRWLRQRPGLVFATRNGRPVDQRNVGRAFHRARTAAGVDHGSLKTFRSTVATQLADAGLHPIKTQAFLGHAHVTTTLTYYTAITRRRRRRRPPPRPHLIDETHHGRRKPILVVRAELRLHETLHQPTGRA
jgi:integrase